MFTTGSKLLIGSAAAAWIFAAVYGIAQDGTLGTLGLVSAAVALSLLAGLNVYVRDSNVSAVDHEAFEASAAAQATARPSLWPFMVALGATMITFGLVSNRTFFTLGVIAVIAGGAEWLVQGWSERASAERRYNDEAREAMADPLELPVAATIFGAIVVYAFSRVMLGLPTPTATVAAFSVVAVLVLAVAAVLSIKRGVSKSTMIGAFSIVIIALIAGGTVAGLNGERDIHPHETTGDLAHENLCIEEETEADEKASQTVAIKSNVAANVVYDGDQLVADVPGFDGTFEELTVVRANPTNVLFRNESDEPARLVMDLHPDTDDAGVPTGPERICTAITESGGVQLVTFSIDRPSFAVEEGFAFTVAGSDAELGVIVP